jgi:AhpD family alkylhydroperoxidase
MFINNNSKDQNPSKDEFDPIITGKPYSVQESYWISYNGIRTLKYMFKAKKDKELNPKFIERIMLAVTEVNDCDICSYAHTKWALESGISNEEIQKILAGNMDDVPADEIPAIIFAQHYADTRGNPTKESWKRIIDIYGTSMAKAILGVIRTIMIGNANGIPWSSFFNRFRGKPDKRSSLKYEISMILSTILIPISLIHAIISNIIKIPLISF